MKNSTYKKTLKANPTHWPDSPISKLKLFVDIQLTVLVEKIRKAKPL